MAEQMKKTAPMAAELVRLTLEFDEAFTAENGGKIWWISMTLSTLR